jgi:hypothetical protein
MFSVPLSTTTLSGVPNLPNSISYKNSANGTDVHCLGCHDYSHLLRYSVVATTRWYQSSIVGMYKMSTPTRCYRLLSVYCHQVSSYSSCVHFSNCSHAFTRFLTSTYISGHHFRYIILWNVPSLPLCTLSALGASISFHFCFGFTNTFVGGSLVLHRR